MFWKEQEVELSSTDRERILTDIAHWKKELKLHGDGEFSADELAEYISTLQPLEDVALAKRWYETVGEWALSRSDTYHPPTVDEDTWLDYQFGLLLDGRETEYGFIVTTATMEARI